jgi:hypothetical protein
MMMNIHDQILVYLKQNKSSSARELSKALDRTVADIRYQLSHLAAEGLVQKSSMSKGELRGRPAVSFTLVPLMPEQLSRGMVSGLLETFRISGFDQKTKSLVMDKIIDSLIAEFHPHGSSAVRMNQAVDFLDLIGIKVKWEARRNGPKITLLEETVTEIIGEPELSTEIIDQVTNGIYNKAVGDFPTA